MNESIKASIGDYGFFFIKFSSIAPEYVAKVKKYNREFSDLDYSEEEIKSLEERSVPRWHLSFVCENDEGADVVVPDVFPVWNKTLGIQGRSLLGFYKPGIDGFIQSCINNIQSNWVYVYYNEETHTICRHQAGSVGEKGTTSVDLDGIEKFEANINRELARAIQGQL